MLKIDIPNVNEFLFTSSLKGYSYLRVYKIDDQFSEYNVRDHESNAAMS